MMVFLTTAYVFPVSLKSWFAATDVGAFTVLAFSIAMAIMSPLYAFIDL